MLLHGLRISRCAAVANGRANLCKKVADGTPLEVMYRALRCTSILQGARRGGNVTTTATATGGVAPPLATSDEDELLDLSSQLELQNIRDSLIRQARRGGFLWRARQCSIVILAVTCVLHLIEYSLQAIFKNVLACTIQEDTIIFCIIERAQFAANAPVYQADAVPVPQFDTSGQRYSLLEYILRKTEVGCHLLFAILAVLGGSSDSVACS